VSRAPRVVHLESASDASATLERVRQRLATAHHAPWAESQLAIGASRTKTDVVELPALREATLALTARIAPAAGVSIARFDDLGAERLMALASNAPQLSVIARAALGPLGNADRPGATDLGMTLESLLAHNMRLSEVADELSFHYNTMRHRLARLRAVVGDRMSRPEERVALSLALAALRVSDLEEPPT
jgi:purine catabolism regulator